VTPRNSAEVTDIAMNRSPRPRHHGDRGASASRRIHSTYHCTIRGPSSSVEGSFWYRVWNRLSPSKPWYTKGFSKRETVRGAP
jgi:hypothetical protein